MRKTVKSVLILAIASLVLSPALMASLDQPTLKEYYYLGEFYLQVGQPYEAIRTYEEMIRKYPRSREAEKAWLSIGDAYVFLLKEKQGELEQKRGHLEEKGLTAELKRLQGKAESLKRKALNAYQTVVDTFPNSGGLALVRIGKVYTFYSPGEGKTGRVKFREVMNNFPEEAGRAALFLGDSYLQQRKFKKAKTAYFQARLFYPEVAAQAQVLFSRVDRELKDFSSAVVDLSLVLRTLGIDGYFSDYRYHGNIMQEAIDRTSESMLGEGNPQFAIDHLKEIINRYPDTNIALHTRLYLAELYSEQGKADLAREELERLISQYPKSLYAARAYLKKAEIVSDEEALKVYEALQKAFPLSKFWVAASQALANKYIELAQRASDAKEKNAFRNCASTAIKEIIGKFPRSPEADQAREFLKLNKL